ncbi:MAG: acetate--CoA ligase family protein, partial [Gammaproteobacteria bacterium]
MSSRNLEHLLAPRSVALVGASDRIQGSWVAVMRNLLAGSFDGPVWAIGAPQSGFAGLRTYLNVADLPETPDLAVICAPPEAVPRIICELAQRGTRAVVVITDELTVSACTNSTLTAAMLDAARPCELRILGPGGLGMLLPRIRLNASSASTLALPGNLAFIAQSGAHTAAMLDWALQFKVGFSCFLSLGEGADVDFADLLDYLCHDPHTRAILLDVESITRARKFMSAARAAARSKPVIVLKAGDAVYDAAFRRAGLLRADTARELFEAADALQAGNFQPSVQHLMEAPAPMLESFVPRPEEVRDIVRAALSAGRKLLSDFQVRSVLAAYHVQFASEEGSGRARRVVADRGIPELFVSIAVDQTFGPVIRFGAAGLGADESPDRVIELLPLDSTLAMELVSRTRVSARLDGQGGRAPVDRRALEYSLVQLARA